MSSSSLGFFFQWYFLITPWIGAAIEHSVKAGYFSLSLLIFLFFWWRWLFSLVLQNIFCHMTCLAFITYHFALVLLLSFYAWNQGNYWWASLDGRWRNAVKVWDCGRSWQWFDSAVLFFLSFLIVVKKSRNVKSTFLKLKQSNLFSDFGFAGSWLLSMGFL